MSVFAKLFGKKNQLPCYDFVNEEAVNLNFDKSTIRLVVFQDRPSGRVPLYDSKAIKRADETITSHNSFCKIAPECSRIRSWPRANRQTESSLIIPLELPDETRSQSLPKTPSPSPLTSVSGNVRYQLSRLSSDVKMLGEMAFGSLPMKSRGTTLKVHQIRVPHQLMMTEVFPFICTRRTSLNHSSNSSLRQNKTTTTSEVLRKPSLDEDLDEFTSSECGNSRFYLNLHMNSNPDLHQRPSRHSHHSHSSQSGLGSLGNLTTSQNGDTNMKQSASATSLDSGNGNPSEAQTQKSKPVDVPSFELHGPEKAEDDESVPSLSSSNGSSYMSPIHQHRSLSPCGSTTSSMGSAFSGSYASVHKRWIRNQATSLDFTKREKKNGRQNLEALFSKTPLSSATKDGTSTGPTTKLALVIIIDFCDEEAMSTLQKEMVDAVKTFLFTHISLVETHIWRLRQCIERALWNKKDFLHLVSTALDTFRTSLHDLITSPRLPHPVWLRLTSTLPVLITPSVRGDRQFLDRKSLCHSFLWKFSQAVDRLDTKHSNFFFSSLLTAVLTHHLAWVISVSPSESACNSRQYLQKHVANWAENLVKANSYNPLWGQMGDLFGAVTFPMKVNQTVIVGTKKEVIKDLLFILSYFIRCSDVISSSSVKLSPDFWDCSLNQLNFQESTFSSRSIDTVVDAQAEDFGDKTVEFTGPYFDIHESHEVHSSKGNEAEYIPHCRPRSNTVLERRPPSKLKTMADKDEKEEILNHSAMTLQTTVHLRGVDLQRNQSTPADKGASGNGRGTEGDSQIECDAESRPVKSLSCTRTDSGILDDDERLQDSGCFDSLNSDMGLLYNKNETENPGNQRGTGNGSTNNEQMYDWSPIKPIDQRKRSVGEPSIQKETSSNFLPTRGNSGSSSKASSTCQSDEGFDSIPSECTSKDGSPLQKELLLTPRTSFEEPTTKDQLDITKPSSFSHIDNQMESPSDSRRRLCSSKTVMGNSVEIDATELPCLKMEDELSMKDPSSSSNSLHENPVTQNLGFSLLGNFHHTFRPDFALQGTSDRDFLKLLPQHVSHQVENSFLDENVIAGSCIVADLDRFVVDVYSTESSDPTTPHSFTPANLVVNMTESVRDLFKVSSTSSPEFCMMHLEDRLQELYFKSITYSKILPSLGHWQKRDRSELRSCLGFEMSDVPLLSAVASTHEDNLII